EQKVWRPNARCLLPATRHLDRKASAFAEGFGGQGGQRTEVRGRRGKWGIGSRAPSAGCAKTVDCGSCRSANATEWCDRLALPRISTKSSARHNLAPGAL